MTRPNLADLAAFVAVARHRSFRRAATECGVSPSAISHTIRALEERLGVRLLNRTSRSVATTEAGAQLLVQLGPALQDIGTALETVNRFRDTPMGLLRLNIPRSAPPSAFMPVLARFLAANPQMRLELVADDSLVDIVAAGFDAGIRFGETIGGDMIAVPIGPAQRFAVVGSPAYFAVHGRPATPQDLARHVCIRFRYPSAGLYRWEFERKGRALTVEPAGPFTVGEQGLMIAAALDGIGLAFTYESHVADALRDGSLQRVLEDWCPPFAGFHLYYPGRRQLPAGLQRLIAAIRADRNPAQPPVPAGRKRSR